jgi:hypothetical protein
MIFYRELGEMDFLDVVEPHRRGQAGWQSGPPGLVESRPAAIEGGHPFGQPGLRDGLDHPKGGSPSVAPACCCPRWRSSRKIRTKPALAPEWYSEEWRKPSPQWLEALRSQ